MQTDEAAAGYIRGGGGVIDTRRLFRVVVGSTIVALAVLVVVLARLRRCIRTHGSTACSAAGCRSTSR